MAKYIVPFKYLIEVEMLPHPELEEFQIKNEAIALAIECFEKEFKKDSLNDMAHIMAPVMLADVHQVK